MPKPVKADKKILEEMLAAACHFGHKVSKWNPKMRKYLYAKRDGIHIFDLAKSYECLVKATEFLRDQASRGKIILLASTKLQATRLVAEAAGKTVCPYVTRKWMPGLLTNFDTISKRIRHFKDLKKQQVAGEWEKYKKKERLDLARDTEKLQDAFGGVELLTKVPDVLVVIDAVHDTLALREAKRLGIPTVAICDSNADPDLVTYPIPGNDDAIKSLRYFVDEIVEAIADGKANPKKPEGSAQPKNKDGLKKAQATESSQPTITVK